MSIKKRWVKNVVDNDMGLASSVRKQFERTRQQGGSFHSGTTGVPIMTDTSLGRSR